MTENNSNNPPKPYDKPDQHGNIFNPKDRILKAIPFKRVFITDAEYLGPGMVPTVCADTEQPRIIDSEIFINFCMNVDALKDPEVFRILQHDRYELGDNEQARREAETPEQYIARMNPELTEEEVKAKAAAKDYPADVGKAYEDRKIIHEKLHFKHITDDEQALVILIDHIVKIARHLYEQEDEAGKHSVCILDIFDTLINSLPDIDYLAFGYAEDDAFLFIRETLEAAGYTGYLVNPFMLHGGKFTGKEESDITDRDIEGYSAPTISRAQVVRMLDANIDRLRRKEAGA